MGKGDGGGGWGGGGGGEGAKGKCWYIFTILEKTFVVMILLIILL